MLKAGRGGRVIVPITLLILVLAPGASGHVIKASGPFLVEMGWESEPPLANLDNSVNVNVSDSSGAPVEVPAGALSVEVAYGDAVVTLPLIPDQQPGRLHAQIVPARPGTYSFHVTGSVDGRTLDASATCSEATFQCVGESSDVEFPVKDPTTGEIVQRLAREGQRVEEASDEASNAKGIAIAALAVATLALGVAASVGIATRGRRKGERR